MPKSSLNYQFLFPFSFKKPFKNKPLLNRKNNLNNNILRFNDLCYYVTNFWAPFQVDRLIALHGRQRQGNIDEHCKMSMGLQWFIVRPHQWRRKELHHHVAQKRREPENDGWGGSGTPLVEPEHPERATGLQTADCQTQDLLEQPTSQGKASFYKNNLWCIDDSCKRIDAFIKSHWLAGASCLKM